MFKRIKKIWNMSGQNDVVVVKNGTLDEVQAKQLAAMTGKVVVFADDVNDVRTFNMAKDEELGDGKAEFLGEGTEEEYKKQLNEENGTDSWLKRIGL